MKTNEEKMKYLMGKYPAIFSLFMVYDEFPDYSHDEILEMLGDRIKALIFMELSAGGDEEIMKIIKEIEKDMDRENQENPEVVDNLLQFLKEKKNIDL